MLNVPLCIVASRTAIQIPKASKLLLILALLLSTSYIFSSPENSYTYLQFFPEIYCYIPTGYLQTTVSVNHIGELVNLISNTYSLPPQSILFVPSEFYGWFLLYGNYSSNIRLVNIGEFSQFSRKPICDRIESYVDSISDKQVALYVFWWSKESTWYHDIGLPNQVEVYIKEGNFSIYIVYLDTTC